MRAVLLLSLLATSTTAFALPPGADPAWKDGANHRVGDGSFVAAFGRLPTDSDSERVRMKTHLQHVRAQLASQPATKPELAGRRAELLGYLDDYIAKGTTPVNTRLPWRTPVFIDDRGNICAVGYLIERSVGRALPEKIAATHRYEFLEDIAEAMPEVRAWVAESGLSLDELASIQPGYAEPAVESWGWSDYVAMKAPDGEFTDELSGARTTGKLRRGKMEGTWTRTSDDRVIGKGTFRGGRGTWTSYEDGKRIAVGSMANNKPHGRWTLYHTSGNVAAIGSFADGHRDGAWQFFNDTRQRRLLASGQFWRGQTSGKWRHYDTKGTLLAVTRDAGAGDGMTSRGGVLMTIVPGRDGITHEVHSFGGMDARQLHMVARGKERLFVGLGNTIHDAAGNQLRHTDEGWTIASCGWSKKRKAIAAAGDITTLHKLLHGDGYSEVGCTANPRSVSKQRAASIEATLGVLATIRAPSPGFVKQLALGDLSGMGLQYEGYQELVGKPAPGMVAAVVDPDADVDPDVARTDPNTDDMVRILAASLAWFIEYPHIDGRFIHLFRTIPGGATKTELYDETRRRNPDAELAF